MFCPMNLPGFDSDDNGLVALDPMVAGKVFPLGGDGVVALRIESVGTKQQHAAYLAGEAKPNVQQFALSPEVARQLGASLLKAANVIKPPETLS